MFEQGQIFADRYTIEELLGEGGFSYVFKATQLGLGRPVALKIIHARRLSMPLPDSSNQQLERLHERFEQEARTISQLASPHTVTLYDYGIDAGGCPFMVLEFIDGMDLSEVISRQGAQPPERVIEILRQVLESLAEAHAYGLLHRDIKPANIVMTQDVRGRDQVKLLDFGLAKVFASGQEERRDLTSESQIIGTPRYMSPEQIMTPRDLTSASDIYSLGLVGFELLTGRPALDGVDTMSLIASQISNDSFSLSPSDGVPPALASVINRMLSKATSGRHATAEEVLAALDEAARVGAHPAATLPRPVSAGPSTERKLILATFVVIMLSCVLVVVVVLQSTRSSEASDSAASSTPSPDVSSVASKERGSPAAEVGEDAPASDGAGEAEQAAAGDDPVEDGASAGAVDGPADGPADEGDGAAEPREPDDEIMPTREASRDETSRAKAARARAARARAARARAARDKAARDKAARDKAARGDEPDATPPAKTTKKAAPKVDAFIMEP